MFDFVNFAADKLQLFLLIMLRASGLFLIAPILGHRVFPVPAKVGCFVRVDPCRRDAKRGHPRSPIVV